MAEPLRHRQTKGAETDMPSLPPPRHIPTLPRADPESGAGAALSELSLILAPSPDCPPDCRWCFGADRWRAEEWAGAGARRALSNWERPQAAWRQNRILGLGRRFETGATCLICVLRSP